MKICIEIEEREINNLAHEMGEDAVIEELRRDPGFFIANASNIIVYMPQAAP